MKLKELIFRPRKAGYCLDMERVAIARSNENRPGFNQKFVLPARKRKP